MTKSSFLKLTIIFTAILIITGTGYAGLKIWKDIKEISKQLSQPLVIKHQPKDEPEPIVNEIDTSEIDTYDWEIYRDKEYHFEIRYPKQWEIDIKKGERETFQTKSIELSYFPDPEDFFSYGLGLYIGGNLNPKNFPIIEWLKENKELQWLVERPDWPPLAPLEPIMITETMGLQFPETLSIIFTKDTHIFYIQNEFGVSESLTEEEKLLFSTILKTFKIIQHNN